MTTSRTTAVKYLGAVTALGALAVLGVNSVTHTPEQTAVASAKPPPAPSYVKPQVPAMKLGPTIGEMTTTTTAESRP